MNQARLLYNLRQFVCVFTPQYALASLKEESLVERDRGTLLWKMLSGLRNKHCH